MGLRTGRRPQERRRGQRRNPGGFPEAGGVWKRGAVRRSGRNLESRVRAAGPLREGFGSSSFYRWRPREPQRSQATWSRSHGRSAESRAEGPWPHTRLGPPKASPALAQARLGLAGAGERGVRGGSRARVRRGRPPLPRPCSHSLLFPASRPCSPFCGNPATRELEFGCFPSIWTVN